MIDVTAIGELLIDFTPSGANDLGMNLFARNPGGAPANVLAMNARLGGRTAFIGKVGDDDFGRFLKQTLVSGGVGIDGLVMSPDVNTTLAFVQLTESGDRSFSFYRKPGADMMLDVSELKPELMTDCHILHFGSVSLTDEPCRTATLAAAKMAKDAGRIISYDPNFRPPLWDDHARAKKEILDAMPLADIVKVSEEELTMLTAETDLVAGAKKLAAYGPTLILVSLGPKGAFFYTANATGILPTYDVKTVDTTGAGDAFLGAIHFRLRGMSVAQIGALDQKALEDIIAFGNAAGSLTTTKKGAIPAMPDMAAIEACMKDVPLLK